MTPRTKKTGSVKPRKSQKRFPKKELNAWLRQHTFWNHQDWLALLDDLRHQGFTDYTDTQEGRDKTGTYLEENRSRAL